MDSVFYSAMSEEKKSATKKKESTPRRRVGIWISALVISLLVVVVGALAVYMQFLETYENSFFPGVYVAGHDLSGMEYLDALDVLEEPAATLTVDGIAVEYVGAPEEKKESGTLRLPSLLIPTDAAGNEILLFTVDFERALDAAYAVGREGPMVQKVKEQLAAALYGRELPIDFSFERDFIADVLEQQFSQFENPSTNASITISESGEPELSDERIGQAFNFARVITQLEDQVRTLDTSPLAIALEQDFPTVTIDDIQSQIDVVNQYLDTAPLSLAFEDHTWSVDRTQLGSWLSFEGDAVTVDPALLEESVTDIADEVNVDVVEARWKVEKDEYGVLTGFSTITEAQNGRTIDYAATAVAVEDRLKGDDQLTGDSIDTSIQLVVATEPAKFSPENISDLGITTILGTGHSNMSGSPVNRRGNIDRGIELLNGLLIAPDEEISLIETLKPFTLENGYVAELVIKGNETVPEVGGGLCQIGTTTFRAVMEAGLNVLQRRNHSYAVSYYSDDRNGQPGTDATIYDPAPDFVFKNDTPNYLLLQTRREGNDLYFDFWGTDDGRDGSFSAPVAYNWNSPPPTKEVETDTLAPGQRRCTESAHSGVTADFTYTVQYADGTTHEEVFHSVYKPWQAVCLVGKDPNASVNEEVDSGEEPDETADAEEKPPKKNKEKEKKNSST